MEGGHKIHSYARYIFFLCTACLVGIVLTLGAVQVVKCTQDLTTYTERTEKKHFLRYPPISFCPGFKTNDKAAAIWSQSYGELAFNRTFFPETKEALRHLWEKTTYGLDEFVQRVRLTRYGTVVYRLVPGKRGPTSEEECIDIKELSTYSGRCYTLSFPCSGDTFLSSLGLKFNLSGMERKSMSWYIHDNLMDAPFGLSSNFWLLPATNKEVSVNKVLEFALQKRIQKKQKGTSTEAYYGCIQRRLTALAGNLVEQNAMCMAPIFEALLSFSTLDLATIKPCTNHQEYLQAYSNISGILVALYWSSCEHPSLKVTYTTSKKELLLPYKITDGTVIVNFFYDTREITILQEYKLMDLGTLLSTLGGLIGMFLGWSLLDIARFLCHTLNKIISR